MSGQKIEAVGQKIGTFVLYGLVFAMGALIAAPFFLVMYAPLSTGL
jgi:hypothetical protein